MAYPYTPSQEERWLARIRERQARCRDLDRDALYDVATFAWADIEFLLRLLDSRKD